MPQKPQFQAVLQVFISPDIYFICNKLLKIQKHPTETSNPQVPLPSTLAETPPSPTVSSAVKFIKTFRAIS